MVTAQGQPCWISTHKGQMQYKYQQRESFYIGKVWSFSSRFLVKYREKL